MTGEALKAEGVARAEGAAGDVWKEQAVAVIRLVAETHQKFTTDQVWELLSDPPGGERRAITGAMNAAAAAGFCRPLEQGVSDRPERHKGFVTIWASLVYQGRPAISSRQAANRYRDLLNSLATDPVFGLMPDVSAVISNVLQETEEDRP